MMIYVYLSIYFLLGFSEATYPSDWKLIKAVDNLEVFTRSTVESKFKEVKINGKIKCTMSEIVAALEDIDAQKQWVMRTLDVELIEERAQGDFSYYITTDMPFPIKDRELVVDHKRTQDQKGQVVIKSLTSKHQLTPHAEFVRIPYYSSIYSLQEMQDGWIKIQYEVKLDPGGILPAWVYNLAVTKGPFSSFQELYDLIGTGVYKNAVIKGL